MSKMPEKKDEEEKTSEKLESKESEEKESEEESEKTKELSEEEELEKEPEKEPEEPKKRFPKKEQTTEDKKLGYEFRQWKKRKLEGTLDEEEFEEEEKPVTRKELDELLEKKDRETASERMVQEFLSENPDFRKYEKTIRKYVNDPDYSNVPIGFIASGIVGENLDDEANLRADLKRKADEESEKTKSGGSTKRGVPGKKKSIWDMSKDEFEEYQTEVLRKSRE